MSTGWVLAEPWLGGDGDNTAPLVPAATIVLDCINLSPAAGKVTPRDVACVSLLEERFPELPARDAVFQALYAAKFDITGGCARAVAPRCTPLSLGTGRWPGPHPLVTSQG